MMSYIALYVSLHYDVILGKNSKTWPNEYVFDPYYLIKLTGFSYMIKRIRHLLTVEIKFHETGPEKCY